MNRKWPCTRAKMCKIDKGHLTSDTRSSLTGPPPNRLLNTPKQNLQKPLSHFQNPTHTLQPQILNLTIDRASAIICLFRNCCDRPRFYAPTGRAGEQTPILPSGWWEAGDPRPVGQRDPGLPGVAADGEFIFWGEGVVDCYVESVVVA